MLGEWKAFVKRTKQIFKDCNTKYNPLSCVITERGFDAKIDTPLVPYIGEYYCDPGWEDAPLDQAIEYLKKS